jgi:hypothetical protein
MAPKKERSPAAAAVLLASSSKVIVALANVRRLISLPPFSLANGGRSTSTSPACWRPWGVENASDQCDDDLLTIF